MDPNSRSMSVVIASKVGSPFIDDCLMSLKQQVESSKTEVIVIACGTGENAERLLRKFPWVRVIHHAEWSTIPYLRCLGVDDAKGDLVAIIEEHCLAAPNWLDKALEAYGNGRAGVIGGPVADYSYKRLRDWVVYFCEYNLFMPPWSEGEKHNLGGANIAYSRALLLKNRNLLAGGYWEAGLHASLAAQGVKFETVPAMIVYHRGPFKYGYYLKQRYWFSRAFAGTRSQNLRRSRKLMYFAFAPLVPFLLLGRMTKQVLYRRCHIAKFLMCLPLLVPVLVVYVTGELVGYAAGSGDALLKVE